jgi:hypothetical protein
MLGFIMNQYSWQSGLPNYFQWNRPYRVSRNCGKGVWNTWKMPFMALLKLRFVTCSNKTLSGNPNFQTLNWEANISSASQERNRFLWKLKVHQIPPLLPIPSQVITVHDLPYYLFKINSDFFLLNLRSFQGILLSPRPYVTFHNTDFYGETC